MGDQEMSRTAQAFEDLLAGRDSGHYVLKLYVTGMTPRSQRAIENLRAICEAHLKSRYSLEIIDIFEHPILAEGEQIVAAPTLIKQLPEPLRRMVGDLSNTERVLLGLDLREMQTRS